jgi:ABC-type multidrug transport system ATPase subunit
VDAIVVDELRKRYGNVQALEGVSFAVRAGEVFGLLGPNGAGKSTTVKVLATLTKPDAGRARSPATTSSGSRTPCAAQSATYRRAPASTAMRPAART